MAAQLAVFADAGQDGSLLCKALLMKGVAFHDLLSSSLTGQSINSLALEVKPAHLTWWSAQRTEPISLYAQAAHPRIPIHLARADGDDAQARKSGIALHRHHRRSALGQASRMLDRGEAAGDRTRFRR